MQYITVNVEKTAVVNIPESVSTDTATFIVFKAADGSILESGSLTYLAASLWKANFTPDALDTYVFVATDSTLSVSHTEIYQAIGQTITAPESSSLEEKLVIINLALNRLSLKTTDDLEDTAPEVVKAVELWSSCLKECLQAFPWTFATPIEALVEDEDVDPLEYDYAYTYPSTAVKVWRVYGEGSTDSGLGENFRTVLIPGDTNKKVILTNIEDAYVEYTYYLDDAALFDSFFSSVLAYRLAAEMAMPLTGNEDLAKGMMAIYNNMIGEAKRTDAGEKNASKKRGTSSSYVDAR